MHSLNALSLSPAARNWLADSRRPRILHVFDHACNLIDERGELLSVVAPEIGNGPFNLVVGDDVCFSEYLNLESPISIAPDQFTLGDMIIDTLDARLWNPHPDWGKLYSRKDHVLDRMTKSPVPGDRAPISQPAGSLLSSLALADLPSTLGAARRLAGLGIGLTPAGDDFMLGAILATWIVQPTEIARVLAEGIVNTAAPLTTSLSAAFLKSAGRGEAGEVWHEFFDALIDPLSNLQSPLQRLLSVGETSGADAFSGFIGACTAFVERETKSCHS